MQRTMFKVADILRKTPPNYGNLKVNSSIFVKTDKFFCTLPPPGSGAGRGGGAGGSVRESGGGLGKYGAAHEEEYFFNKGKQQLERLKHRLKKEPTRSPPVKHKEDK